MQDIERELRIKQLRLLLIVLLVIFVAMLSYTIFWCTSYNRNYGFFEKTTAEVIEHVEIKDEYYDVLEYTVDGNIFHKTTSYPSKNNIGDVITIYYDTNNPIGVIYSLDNKRIILPVISAIFGVGVVALIVVYFLLIVGNKPKLTSRSKVQDKQEYVFIDNAPISTNVIIEQRSDNPSKKSINNSPKIQKSKTDSKLTKTNKLTKTRNSNNSNKTSKSRNAKLAHKMNNKSNKKNPTQ